MAVIVTFEMVPEEALRRIAGQVERLDGVSAEIDGSEVIVFQERLSLLRRRGATDSELQARIKAVDALEMNQSEVRLDSHGADPWLYRQLIRILDENSLEARVKAEERSQSPFSAEKMWGGGPAPVGNALGGLLGGPPSKKMGVVQAAPEPPGAFTQARDDGRLADPPELDVEGIERQLR